MNGNSPRGPAQVPLLIGVTGHRDLVPEEVASLRAAVRRFLEKLQSQFPDAPLLIATSLSRGADLLVAEEALDLGVDCCAVLPLPLEVYRTDFNNTDWLRFEAAFARCCRSIVCSLDEADAGPSNVPQHGAARTACYAAAGQLIASEAFILLALWDGGPADLVAGTASTVEFRLSRRARLEAGRGAQEELLPNLPPDLVYHVVTSRPGGSPEGVRGAGQVGYRRTIDGPLESDLPASAAMVAARTSELDRDLRRYHARIAHKAAGDNLVGDIAALPRNVIDSAQLFHSISWLAGQMQRYVLRTLILTSALSLAMGLFFVVFGHADGVAPYSYAIFGFVAAFASLVGANQIARSSQWQRRYLEYRTLAEGLRVELFWALAGVGSGGPAPTVHSALLKQSDASLEWIPNAIRACSLSLQEVRRCGIPDGIEFAVRRWVGTTDESGHSAGQLQYYKNASHHKGVSADAASRIASGAALLGFVIAVVLAAEVFTANTSLHALMLGAMGILPLIGGIIEALVQKTAARELKRQYEYMYDVFRAARDRLLAARTDDERRKILTLLGRAALAEHADWLLMHRDRPIDRSRM